MKDFEVFFFVVLEFVLLLLFVPEHGILYLLAFELLLVVRDVVGLQAQMEQLLPLHQPLVGEGVQIHLPDLEFGQFDHALNLRLVGQYNHEVQA